LGVAIRRACSALTKRSSAMTAAWTAMLATGSMPETAAEAIGPLMTSGQFACRWALQHSYTAIVPPSTSPWPQRAQGCRGAGDPPRWAGSGHRHRGSEPTSRRWPGGGGRWPAERDLVQRSVEQVLACLERLGLTPAVPADGLGLRRTPYLEHAHRSAPGPGRGIQQAADRLIGIVWSCPAVVDTLAMRQVLVMGAAARS
jgi:hypothetical protein